MQYSLTVQFDYKKLKFYFIRYKSNIIKICKKCTKTYWLINARMVKENPGDLGKNYKCLIGRLVVANHCN